MVPVWNYAQFGCLTRDNTAISSRMRTALTEVMPNPPVSRKADTSASLELGFALDVSDAGRRAWEQWVTYDLVDGSLPFSIYLPWGTEQPSVHARLVGEWESTLVPGGRWTITGAMEIERGTLPRFSGGAHA